MCNSRQDPEVDWTVLDLLSQLVQFNTSHQVRELCEVDSSLNLMDVSAFPKSSIIAVGAVIWVPEAALSVMSCCCCCC